MTPKTLVDKLAFYKEIAESGVPYDPPASFYNSALEAIKILMIENKKLENQVEDLRNQINMLRKAF